MSHEKNLAKARRLKALADRGEAGEKETARRFLNEFMHKYNIKAEEIGDVSQLRRFRTIDADDTLILNNVILSVNPFANIINGNKFTQVDLDDEDYNEVLYKYPYFVEHWRVEKDWLMMGFFAKNEKHFKPDEYTMKKWREKRKMNEDLKKAHEETAKINEIITQPKPPSSEEMEAMSHQQKIYLLNSRRLPGLVDLMLDANYLRANKTLNKATSKTDKF